MPGPTHLQVFQQRRESNKPRWDAQGNFRRPRPDAACEAVCPEHGRLCGLSTNVTGSVGREQAHDRGEHYCERMAGSHNFADYPASEVREVSVGQRNYTPRVAEPEEDTDDEEDEEEDEPETCPECNGEGITKIDCEACDGVGYFNLNEDNETECKACNGNGETEEPCEECEGEGVVE